MPQIPNYNVLIQELIRARDKAVPRSWEWEDEIYTTYTLVNELITYLWTIDTLVEAIDFNQAIEMSMKFESLANRLFSLNPIIKRVLTAEDATDSWRLSTTNNIVRAIESEARLYVNYFQPFVSSDFVEHFSSEKEDALVVLRTQIRLRIAKDGNQDSTVSTTSSHDDPSKMRTDKEHYLGLLFHDDLAVSRLGNKYRDDEQRWVESAHMSGLLKL